jgi:deoxyribose-phosphate aldolase
MFRSPPVDATMAAERAASFTKRSIKGDSKLSGLLLALSMLDLTTLEGKDSPEKARSLCRKAVTPDATDPALPSVAAVCVYPNLVKPCAETLGPGRRVRIAAVATGFPSGQYPLSVRLDDTRRAIRDGADEIDMVISRGAFLAGRYREVADEVRAVKRVCVEESRRRSERAGESRLEGNGPRGNGAATPGPVASGPVAAGPVALKVILETGELETLDNVRAASDLAIRAMAEVDDELGSYDAHARAGVFDFIKTSTGKVTPAATMPVTLVMLEAIRDWNLDTGRFVGMKPAGGIRTAKQALHYLVMVKETLANLPGGDAFLTPALFRFGASTLANDILRQVAWVKHGRYVAAHDFAEA